MFAALRLVPARNRAEERKGKTMNTEKIWALARYYGELSHEFSKIEDKLVRLAQELEEGKDNEN